jgi:chitin synthase
MARPLPNQNVSFQDSAPPSRRARDDPPTPPAKGYTAKSSSSLGPSMSNIPNAAALNYEQYEGFSASGADVKRKKSMVRPERERIDPGHRLWHYREHAQEDGLNVMPSCEFI